MNCYGAFELLFSEDLHEGLSEGGHGHRVAGPIQAGGDHHDAAGEPACDAPEIGAVECCHERALRALALFRPLAPLRLLA